MTIEPGPHPHQPLSAILRGAGDIAGVDLANEVMVGSVLPAANGGTGGVFGGDGRMIAADDTWGDDFLLIVDSSGGDVTVTLPPDQLPGTRKYLTLLPSANIVHVVPTAPDQMAGNPSSTFDIQPNSSGANVDVLFTVVKVDTITPPPTPVNTNFWLGNYFDRDHQTPRDVVTFTNQSIVAPSSRVLVDGTNTTVDTSVAGEIKINAAGGGGVTNPMTANLDANDFNISNVNTLLIASAAPGGSLQLKNQQSDALTYAYVALEQPSQNIAVEVMDPGVGGSGEVVDVWLDKTAAFFAQDGNLPLWFKGPSFGGRVDFNANLIEKRMGIDTTVGGTVTINTGAVTATCLIFVTAQAALGDIHEVKANRVNGVSFEVNSVLDGDFAWLIIEP